MLVKGHQVQAIPDTAAIHFNHSSFQRAVLVVWVPKVYPFYLREYELYVELLFYHQSLWIKMKHSLCK